MPIDHLLRDLWPGVTVGAPVTLTGGYWAQMWRVPLRGQPDPVADEVVVRLAPSRDMGAKEAAVQETVAAQGFATPAVWFSGPDDASDGWWSVTDFSPGTSLLDGLDGVAALRRAPALVRELPARLAGAMAALHRLDPSPVTAAVDQIGVAWSVTDVLGNLRAGAERLSRPDLIAAIDQLTATAPSQTDDVLCHGDLHPFNILDRDGRTIVLDWTGAVLADPCFDLAFTELLLANPPVALPTPLAPFGRLVGGILARRLVAAYRREAPDTSLADLGWHRAVQSVRVLVEAAAQRASGTTDHPFLRLAPAAAQTLSASAGVAVGAE